MRKLFTNCIIHQNDKVLLGMKKRGFGEGYWNGFGGKVQSEETIKDAAVRELHEEAGITASILCKLGILDFEFENSTDILEVHLFKCTAYTGEIGESEEMRPKWFNVDSVPFHEMWKDDVFWFPLFLKNQKFKGRFRFDLQNNVVESELTELKQD